MKNVRSVEWGNKFNNSSYVLAPYNIVWVLSKVGYDVLGVYLG
jgi:hypothetical protein